MPDNPNFVERRNCPACRSEMFETLLRSDYLSAPIKRYLDIHYAEQGGIDYGLIEGAVFELCRCSSCLLVFQKFILNNQAARLLYERWINPKKAHEQTTAGRTLTDYSAYASEIMMAAAFLRLSPRQMRVMDFGMGWGEWCLMARAFGCSASGSEISQDRIEHARANGIEIVEWEGIPGRDFDLINTDMVFEHLASPLDALEHLVAGLRPGGLLKISVPDGHDILRRLRRADWSAAKGSPDSLNAVSPLEHINCFNYKALGRMAGLAGLRVMNMPMGLQLKYTAGRHPLGVAIRGLLRPLFRTFLGRGTHLFLYKPE